LSGLMDGRAFRGSILLSHLHWDHTHGLPFFAAGDRPDAQVTLLMPAQGDPTNVLARAMSPPHFPIKPSELRGKWRFLGIQEGPRTGDGIGRRPRRGRRGAAALALSPRSGARGR